jgi:hypothetical protein
VSRPLSRAERVIGYGLAGWCSEVLTTGLRSHGRDSNWRLTATTYLWMLPIYGVAAEATRALRADARRRGIPAWHRGLAWTAGIYAVEAASGELLRAVTGEVPWDYSRARGRKAVPANWRGLVRPAYAPVWFLVGLGTERLDDALDRLRVEPGHSG